MPDPIRYSEGDEVSDFLTAADPSIGSVINRVGSVEVESEPTRFATLVHTVLGQQLSESSAGAIIARVNLAIGPTPEAVAAASDEKMRSLGVSRRKTGYLRGIARAVLSGEIDLEAFDTLDDDQVIERLTRIRGVGRWTAQMFLLLALQRPDVVVLDDTGIRAAAGRMLGLGRSASVGELAEAAERWRPHRSAATLYLYRDRSQTREAEISGVATSCPRRSNSEVRIEHAAHEEEVMQMSIELKRVYDHASDSDGYRILVDRLWPRGLAEESARVDLWLRRIAPTTELRKWYSHDVEKWTEFQKRYEAELSGHGELLDLIGDIERHRKTVTILFGAKDENHNEANVLVDVLKKRHPDL